MNHTSSIELNALISALVPKKVEHNNDFVSKLLLSSLLVESASCPWRSNSKSCRMTGGAPASVLFNASIMNVSCGSLSAEATASVALVYISSTAAEMR